MHLFNIMKQNKRTKSRGFSHSYILNLHSCIWESGGMFSGRFNLQITQNLLYIHIYIYSHMFHEWGPLCLTCYTQSTSNALMQDTYQWLQTLQNAVPSHRFCWIIGTSWKKHPDCHRTLEKLNGKWQMTVVTEFSWT